MAQPQLTAEAKSAGSLISTKTFVVPEFQREYAWIKDEYEEFWNDLHSGISERSYFLGLIILTAEGERMHVVDGQQRLISVTLLAAALRHEAIKHRRAGLADQIESTFLKALDYDTDEYVQRIRLSDTTDNETLLRILDQDPELVDGHSQSGGDSLSGRIVDAFKYLHGKMRTDLADDPFRRLSLWTQFLTDHLYFAVFVHPDPAAAYKVFEVVNTRGRALTTADLLKNYLLSQTALPMRSDAYSRWQSVSKQFPLMQPATFVQFIRHVVSLSAGYVLPRDLYDFLSQRRRVTTAPSVADLLGQMERWLPLYLQMMDPAVEGPATQRQLKIFEALNELGVSAVRPLLMAISELRDADDAMEYVLRIVMRRAVVGNLGTSGAERRFSEAARLVAESGAWAGSAADELSVLDATRDDFVEQLRKRSFNKSTLQFARRSIVQDSRTPEPIGSLQLIRPRSSEPGAWPGFEEEEASYWGATIGNAVLIEPFRRPRDTSTWEGVRANLLPVCVEGEWRDDLGDIQVWTADAVAQVGRMLAEKAADVWF